MIADILKVKETQMRNILKLGLISAVTAIALAQTPATPAQGMDEDVLAIATRGALSDSMQGFRKLADDEAGSIWGGVNYTYDFYRGITDNSGTVQYFKAYFRASPDGDEERLRKINIGNGYNAADYMNFKFIEDTQRGEYVYIEASYVRGKGDSYQVMKGTTNRVTYVTYLTEFTSRLARDASIKKSGEFARLKNAYFNGAR